jgi:hypothetical protein
MEGVENGVRKHAAAKQMTMTCFWMKFTLIYLPFISSVEQLSRHTRFLLPFSVPIC